MLRAHYFDGRSAKRTPVRCEIANGLLRVYDLPAPLAVPVEDVTLSEPLGRTRRSIALPGGARLELPADIAADELAALAPRTSALLTFVHALEQSWRGALLVMLLGGATLALALYFGAPALSRQIALRTPDALRASLGEQALASLAAHGLARSRLEPARADAVRALFAAFANDAGLANELRLELRRGGRIGANALALPAGIIVVTDELIERAEHDEHLLAVFAHEAGHVVHRHALRTALQNAASATLLLIFLGDVPSLVALAASVPALLMQSSYSRRFEHEADDYAYRVLARQGIPRARFAEILQRLAREDADEESWADYFSTHPKTRERIR